MTEAISAARAGEHQPDVGPSDNDRISALSPRFPQRLDGPEVSGPVVLSSKLYPTAFSVYPNNRSYPDWFIPCSPFHDCASAALITALLHLSPDGLQRGGVGRVWRVLLLLRPLLLR